MNSSELIDRVLEDNRVVNESLLDVCVNILSKKLTTVVSSAVKVNPTYGFIIKAFKNNPELMKEFDKIKRSTKLFK